MISSASKEHPSQSDSPIPFPKPSLRPPTNPSNILLFCGSFSPITFMHLRLLSLARHHFSRTHRPVHISIISPCSCSYPKPSLLPAHHRLAMVQLALHSHPIPHTVLDPWEAMSPSAVPTWRVAARLKELLGPNASIWLVCGADLMSGMADPSRWPPENVRRLLEHVRIVCLPRGGLNSLPKFDAPPSSIEEMQGVSWELSSTQLRCVLNWQRIRCRY